MKKILLLSLFFMANAFAQTLTISEGSSNPAASNESGAAQNVVMLQLEMSADNTEDLLVTSLTVTPTASGLVRSEILDPEIRLYRDVNNNGVFEVNIDQFITSANYTGANWQVPGAQTISLSEIIYAGTTENWLILNSYSGGDAGDNISVSIALNGDVSAEGVTSSTAATITGAPADGTTKSIVAVTSGGSLFAGSGANNPISRNIADGADGEVMLQVILSASSVEDIDISSITFDMSGSGNESLDLNTVRLYNDVDGDGILNLQNDSQIGSTLTTFSDNGTLDFTGVTEVISASTSENWIVVYDYNASQTSPGETYQTTLTASGDVTADGASSALSITTQGLPVSGGLATISATGTLALSAGVNNPDGHTITANEQSLSMLQLQLLAGATEDVDITSITFSTSGTADESADLDSARLMLDADDNGLYDPAIDTQIGTTITSFSDNGSITFGSLTEQISASESENWMVVYSLGGTPATDETFRVYLNANSDVTASGTGAITPSGAPVQGNPMVVSGVGALSMSIGSNDPGLENISGSAQNVTMMQLNLSASSVEDVEITSIQLTPIGVGLVRSEIVDPEIRLYRDVNNNGVFESTTDELITTANYAGANWAVPAVTTISLSRTIYAGSSENWLIVNSFAGGDVGNYLEVGITENVDITATGVSSSQSVIISGASVSGGRKSVVSGTTPGTLALSVGGNDPGYRNISTSASNEVMLQLLLSAGSSESIEISEITLDMSGTGNESTDIDSVRLYQDVDNNGVLNILNDRQIGSQLTGVLDNGSLVFTGISEIIDAGLSENWLVVYNFQGSASDGETFRVGLAGNAAVVDTGVTSGEAVTTTGAPLESGIATISPIGSLTQGSNNPNAHNISADEQDLVMMQLNLAANHTESIDVSEINITTTGSADESTDLDSVKLYLDVDNNGQLNQGVDTQIGSAITSISQDDPTLTFSSLTEQVALGTNENWLVVYYLSGTADSSETFRVYINSNTDLDATGATSGSPVIPIGAPVQGNPMTVSPSGALAYSLGANNPGEENINGSAQNVTMMQLNLAASSSEDVEVTSIQFTPTGNGLVRSEIVDPEVRIYKDVNNNGVYESTIDELITTANYAGANWAVPGVTTINLSRTIYAGNTENWLIVNSFAGGDVGNYLELGILQNTDITATGVSSGEPADISGTSISGSRKTVTSGATAGTMTLSVGGNDPGYRNISASATDEVMFQLLLSAGSNEAVKISEITLAMSGTGDESGDITNARLYEDVDNNGILNTLNDRQIGDTLISFTNDGNLVYSGISEIVDAGGSENWLVVYNMSGSASVSETFRVGLAGNGAVVDTGVTSGEAITTTGAPLESGLATVSDVGTLSLSAGLNNPPAHNVADDEQNLSMVQLLLSAGATEAVDITSITFSTSGTAFENTALDSARLLLDVNNNGSYDFGIDTQMGTTVTSFSDDGTIVFGSLTEQISASGSENWLVVYDLNGTAGNDSTLRVYLNSNSDLTATGATSLGSIIPSGTPVQGNSMTVSSVGALTMALGSNDPGAENINGGAQNVTMLQLNLLASSVEDIEITELILRPTGNGLVRSEIVDPEVRIYNDVNNNGVYESSIDELITTVNYAGANWAVPGVTTISLSRTIYAGTNENWLIVNSFAGGDVDNYLEIGVLNNSDITATGVSSSQSVSVTGASVNGGRKTVSSGTTPGTLTLSVGGNDPGYRNISASAADEVMFQLLLSAGSNESIEISEISLAMSGSGDESLDITNARLYEDVDNNGILNILNDRQIGDTLLSLTNDGNLVYTGISEIINAGGSENWLIVYTLSGSASVSETFRVGVAGNAAVVDTGVTSGEAITTTGAPLESGIATVSDVGTLSLIAGSNNPASRNIAADEQNLSMIQLLVSAGATEAVDITSITFSTSGTVFENTALDSARLLLDVNNNGSYELGIDTQIGTTVTSFSDNGAITFGSLSEQISAGGSENWMVVYDLNGSAGNDSTLRVYLNSNSDLTASGATSSSSIIPTGAPIQGNPMTVSSVGALTMALGSNDPGVENINGNAQNVTMLQLNLSASSVEDVEITELILRPTGSGLVRSEIVDPEVRIYNDVNNNGVYESSIDQLITTENYAGANWAVPGVTTISLSRTIYAGTSENWLIVNSFAGGDVDNYLEIGVLNNSDITATGVISSQSVSVTGATVNGGRKTVSSGTTPGTLTLSVGGNDPGYRNISASATDEVMFQLLLSAGSNEAIEISEITLAMSGSGDESSDITNARLYEDVDNNGILNTLNDRQIGDTLISLTNDGNLVYTGISEIVDAGGSENWLVVYTMSGSAGEGETFQVGVAGNAAVVDTGVTSGEAITTTGAPLVSGIATVSQTGSLVLAAGSNNPQSQTIGGSELEFEMLQLQMTAGETENVEITSMTFSTSGSGNESTAIDSVKLIRDINNNGQFDPAFDPQIGSTLTSLSDDGSLSFPGISDTVVASGLNNYLVVYYFNGSASNTETFRTYVNNASQISAQGLTSLETIIPSGLPVNGNTMTVSAIGSLAMSLSANNAGDQNVNGNATDLVMMSLSLSANNVEDLIVTEITITPTGSGLVRGEIVDPEVRIYNDVNQNGTYESSTDQEIATANYSGANWAVPSVVTIPIDSVVVAAQSTANWIIVNSFSGGDLDNYLELAILQNSDVSGIGAVTRSAMNVSGATLNGGRKTIVSATTPGTLTLNAGTTNPDYRFISRGEQDEVMIQLQLTASPIEDIEISSIQFDASGTGDESADVDSARLYLDVDNDGNLTELTDVQIGSTIIPASDNGSMTFNNLTEVITSGSSENWIIVYNFNLAENALTETFRVTLPGNDAIVDTGATSGEAITPTGAPVVGGEAVISETGTLILSAGGSNPPNTNIAGDESDLEVIQMAVSAGSNENILVSSATFTVSGSFADGTDFVSGSIQLYLDDNGDGMLDGGDTQLGTDQSWSGDNGTATFSSLNHTILLNTTQYWIVVCDLSGTASNGENFRINMQSNANISAIGETTSNSVIPTGAPVAGGLFSISNTGSMTLSLGSNNPPASSETASAANLVMQQLALSASSVENINVNSITFTADGTGDDLADLTGVSLYIDENNDGQLDGGDTQIDIQRAFSGNNGTVTFTTTGQSVNAGTTENWLVVYELDGSASEGETFRVGIYNSGDITCVGATSTQSITAGGTPVVGNFKTISTTGSITLAVGANNPASSFWDNTAIGNVEMLQFRLTTSSVEAVDISDVTITHQGTGDPVNDLTNTRLIRDNDGDGIYDVGTDDILATATFTGTSATFSLTGISIAADDSELWLVIYNFVADVSTGSSFITILQQATDVSCTGSVSSNPIIPSGTFPVSGGTQTLTAYSSLTIIGSDISASPSPGSQNVALMSLNLTVNKDVSTIYSLQVDNRAVVGVSAASDVDLIQIYREDGTSGNFQDDEDELLGGNTVSGASGGSANITLGSGLDISGSGEILYVVFDISATADPLHSVGVRIESTGYLSVLTPETILNPVNFPIANTQDVSLPVELTSFIATGAPGAIIVEWETASELNNVGFTVQRRIENSGDQFESVSSYTTNPDLEGQINSSTKKQYAFEDTKVIADSTYEYRLIQQDLDGSQHPSGSTVAATALEKLPSVYTLKQNYPNPFNPQTTIAFELPEAAKVSIEIYDILGRKVISLLENEEYKAGSWDVVWDGKNSQYNRVASGMYFYRITANKFNKIMKMTMLK